MELRGEPHDPSYRLGDNLYTSSAIAFDAANGKIRWYHQYTPNDDRDYDETGSHIIIDTKVNGEDRRFYRTRAATVSSTPSTALTASSSRRPSTSRA